MKLKQIAPIYMMLVYTPCLGATVQCNSSTCNNRSITLNGTFYCDTGSYCSAGTSNYAVAHTFSTMCDTSNKSGSTTSGTQKCLVVYCTNDYQVTSDYTSCTCPYPCGIGYYGCGRNANKDGCHQCIENAYVCTSQTEFTCKQGYYKNEYACVQCPPTGMFTDESRTSVLDATTNGPGRTTITECLVRPGTYYDQAGVIQISSNATSGCYYSN